jgi:Starch/carbohydrate-binding module (family 53)
MTMHWGYNNWTSSTDTAMTKQSNGTWSATIAVPSGATVINTAYKNQSSSWDNNGSSNYNLPVGSCFIKAVSTTSCPTIPGASITIVYSGTLASSASSITMHWSYDSWNGLIVDTTMSQQSNGTWTATITVPSGAATLNMAFKNQSSTWDSNGGSNYNLNT